MSAKTPKATPAAAAQQLAAKSAQKPAPVSAAKKVVAPKEIPSKSKKEEEDSESDDDDVEEKQVLTTKATPAAKKKSDPEDEDMDEEEDEEYEDEDEGLEIDLTDRLRFGYQQGLTIPAGEAVLVRGALIGDRMFPFHITNACLGPDAKDGDRATLLLQQESLFAGDNDDEDDENEHGHSHDHEGHDHSHVHNHDDDDDEDEDEDEDEDIMQIVCGTLCKDKTENLALDLVINGDFLLVNNSEATEIHITGRLLPDHEDYDEDDEDFEDEDEMAANEAEAREDIDEDDDMDEDDDDDEEDEEEKAAQAKRAANARKRIFESNGEESAKQAKVEPKVIDVKAAKSTSSNGSEKKAATPSAAGAKPIPTADVVRDFIVNEVKTKKAIKGSDMGSAISSKFGLGFKNMGFPEKSISKFVETHCKGKVNAKDDTFTAA